MMRAFSFRAPVQQRTFSDRTCARTGAHAAQCAPGLWGDSDGNGAHGSIALAVL
jgi:hypothetical protein